MAELEEAFREASQGRPASVAVSGEPGVGKTRLVAEMTERWSESAARASVAASPGAKPALRNVAQLLRSLPTSDQLVDDALDEVRQLRQRADEDDSDPGELVAYTAVDALLGHARNETLVVSVDDYQWADEASARTLTTLARETDAIGADINLLIVVTVREGDDASSGRLAELGRCSNHQAIRLDPLADDEIAQLIRAHGVDRPSLRLVRDVTEFSGGNPLFVREAVLRTDQSGRWRVGPHGTDADIPRGWLGAPGDLDALVTRRTDALGPDVRRVLEYAALSQGDFVPARLALAVPDGLDVKEALDRAADAGLIEPTERGWTFAHASLRQALAASPDTRQRATIHHRLADALAADEAATDDLVLAEANHRVRSDTTLIDREGFDCLQQAGRLCLERGAWTEAAEILSAAEEVADNFAISAVDRGWMHYRLGQALIRSQRREAARNRFEQAVATGAERADEKLRCRALIAIARQEHRLGTDDLDEILIRISEAIPQIEVSAPDEAMGLEMLRVELLLLLDRIDEAAALARKAHDRATESGHPADTAETASVVGMTMLAAGRPSDALKQLESIDRTDPADRGLDIARQALAQLMRTNLTDAASLAKKAGEEFAEVRQRWGQSLTNAILLNVDALQGNVAEAYGRAERCQFLLAADSYLLSALILYPASAELNWWLGDERAARADLEAWSLSEYWTPGVAEVVFAARSGDLSIANEIRGKCTEYLTEPRPTILTLAYVAPLAEAARIIGDPELGPPLREALARIEDPEFLLSPGCLRLVAGVRADLALLAGDHAQAAKESQEALTIATEAGAFLELTRSRIQLGTNNTLRRQERVDHLNGAVGLADRLGLWRLVEQASAALADLAEPVGGDRESAPYRIVMITDLVGSTALSAKLGDRAYLEAIDRHHRLVRDHLSRHAAHEFDTTGDGIIAWFEHPDEATTCARAIVKESQATRTTAGPPMEIRIGLAGGYPLERDGYLYGATLNLAARLCSEAPPNGIVTDSELRNRCASTPGFHSLGGLDLEGIPRTDRGPPARPLNLAAVGPSRTPLKRESAPEYTYSPAMRPVAQPYRFHVQGWCNSSGGIIAWFRCRTCSKRAATGSYLSGT